MPNNNKSGQAQYARLITSLASPEAIAQGIVTPKNVTPVLFFFMSVGTNDIVGPWLMPQLTALKESRWLQIVGWLMEQCVFLESKKSRVADFLVDMSELGCSECSRSVQNSMAKSLSPDIQRELRKEFSKFF